MPKPRVSELFRLLASCGVVLLSLESGLVHADCPEFKDHFKSRPAAAEIRSEDAFGTELHGKVPEPPRNSKEMSQVLDWAYYNAKLVELRIRVPHAGKWELTEGRIFDTNWNQSQQTRYYRLKSAAGISDEFTASEIKTSAFVASESRYDSKAQISPGEKPSAFARRIGIPYLKHETRDLDSLRAILKSKALIKACKRSPNVKTLWYSANYLSFSRETDHYDHDFWEREGANSFDSLGGFPPVLLFDTALLDRADYYINPGAWFGSFSELSIVPTSVERFTKFLDFFANGFNYSNEVVFFDDIPIEALSKIIVPVEKRALTLKMLESSGIAPPIGRAWEEIVPAAATISAP